MKYEIPPKLTYRLLSDTTNAATTIDILTAMSRVGCFSIKCDTCVLNLFEEGSSCGLLRGLSTDILDRLVEHDVITKTEALDLLLRGKK